MNTAIKKAGTQRSIAYFISPHGFGHAARACAVMEALLQKDNSFHFHIYTTVPRWFFKESLPVKAFTYHRLKSDVGLVQSTPLDIDFPASLKQISGFLAFDSEKIRALAKELINQKSRLIICDISPLGIVAGDTAEIPRVLVENFTWDWIYEPYIEILSDFEKIIGRLRVIYSLVEHRIQTQPACRPLPDTTRCAPVSRRSKSNPDKIRRKLGIPPAAKMALISMGGIKVRYDFSRRLHDVDNVFFVIPQDTQKAQREKNLIILPHHSGFYHPDLVNAADVVIGKLGYSTVAEAWSFGVPFAYISRDNFRESAALENFVKDNLPNMRIDPVDFVRGKWINELIPLLDGKPPYIGKENGAIQCAVEIEKILSVESG